MAVAAWRPASAPMPPVKAPVAAPTTAAAPVAVPAPVVAVAPASIAPAKPARPTDDAIIGALALHYRVHESKVIEWLLEMDLQAASARLMNEFA